VRECSFALRQAAASVAALSDLLEGSAWLSVREWDGLPASPGLGPERGVPNGLKVLSPAAWIGAAEEAARDRRAGFLYSGLGKVPVGSPINLAARVCAVNRQELRSPKPAGNPAAEEAARDKRAGFLCSGLAKVPVGSPINLAAW
jgi:hypothetical protein